MILALAFIMLSAKPISIRRLFLLCVFSFAMAHCVLTIFHTDHVATLARQSAVVITLAVWAYPLLCTIRGALRGRPRLDSFQHVSVCVRATYVFALAIAFTTYTKTFAVPSGALSLAYVSRMIAVWLVSGIGFALFAPMFRRAHRQQLRRWKLARVA